MSSFDIVRKTKPVPKCLSMDIILATAEFRSSNNYSFPAQVDDETFLAHLRDQKNIVGEGNINIPTSYNCQAKAAMNNPVAYVGQFKQGIVDIMTILLGRPPAMPAHDGFSMRSTKPYKLLPRQSKGLFGTNLATYGVIESHHKGTLHVHMILYGGVPGTVFQSAAGIPRLCKSVERVLDSMIQCELPDALHYESAARKAMLHFGVESAKLPPLPSPLLLEPTSEGSGPCADALRSPGDKELVDFATFKHCSVKQRHSHRKTCFKGLMGCSGE